MWLFHCVAIGFYDIWFWVIHIPIICTGYLIRDKVRSPIGRRVFWALILVAIILCELACTLWLSGYDRLAIFVIQSAILDLIMGYFLKEIGAFFRRTIDWINEKTA